MKATGILLGLLAIAMAAAVVMAHPSGSEPVLSASAFTMEPAWMVLSGATLLVIASVVRRYLP